jgi:hypothetical protein
MDKKIDNLTSVATFTTSHIVVFECSSSMSSSTLNYCIAFVCNPLVLALAMAKPNSHQDEN